MDKLTEMSVFVEVARAGSFSAAARVLKLSPSAVSKLVTRLEHRLGTRLFNRTTRQVKLTEAGEAYLQRCVSILDQIDDAEELLAGFGREPRGLLTVNSTADFAKYCLVPVMPLFRAQFPQLKFSLQITPVMVDLVAEGVDVALRMGELKDSSLVARKLCESRRIICASPDYLAIYGEPKKAADLRDHNCLTMSGAPTFNQWTLKTSKGRETIQVDGDFIADKVDMLHQHALQGGGLVRLAEFTVEADIAAGRLVPVLERCNQEVQEVHAVYPHREHLPSKVRVFIDFLLEHLPMRCMD
ncbi:LysR family transcriptional regulator [Pseudomaricurvus alkylphenolicus]|uniref:LysR substrate-binding domain-containing protein n=1 Tax=Pseudomaricurvus alkylphenolicus TaxID=1306991 RepID=UPI00142026DE|nr:LysR family transcriptional regulator [Pseudomaricurvus alkylphenolicus]